MEFGCYEMSIIEVIRDDWEDILSKLESAGADSLMEEIYEDVALYSGGIASGKQKVFLTRREYWEMVGALVEQEKGCDLPFSVSCPCPEALS